MLASTAPWENRGSDLTYMKILRKVKET